MADIKINDLSSASVSSSMQLETDIGGTQSNKINISTLTTYLAGVLPITGLTWSVVTSDTPLVPANGYIANSLSLINFTLPASAGVGSTFRITNFSSGGWKINQNSGQTMLMGTQSTTTGVSGFCASTQVGDTVEVVCVNADTDFMVVPQQGNILLT